MYKINLDISFKILALSFFWMASSSFSPERVDELMSYHISKSVNVTINSEGIPEFKKKMYQKDATRLALRYISKGSGYEELGADVPTEVRNELLSCLYAIHKSPFIESVEVTRTHKLHTFPNPAVDKFQVNYKNTAKWATPLRLGSKTTDSKIINDLCSKYNLLIESHRTWDENSNLFIVKAKTAINIAPIAKEFLKEEGVDFIKLLIPDSDGNDIEAVRTSKGWRLDYMVKFDSCFTGCKKKHVWSFEVVNITSDSANVNFIGESGDELPDWMKKID